MGGCGGWGGKYWEVSQWVLFFSQFNPKLGCIKLLLNLSFKMSGIRIKHRDLVSLTFNNNSDSCCSAEYSLKSIGTTAISRNSYSLKVLYNLHAKEPISQLSPHIKQVLSQNKTIIMYNFKTIWLKIDQCMFSISRQFNLDNCRFNTELLICRLKTKIFKIN